MRDGADGPANPPDSLSSLTAGEFKKDSGHTEWVDGRVHQTGFTVVFTPNTVTPITDGTDGADDGDFTSAREDKVASAGLPVRAAVTSRSYHEGMVNVLLMDGSGRSVSNLIDATVWRNLGSRYDGNVIQGQDF